ncbi:GHKL domain-containing protein, partial [Candidatus Dependentiae bacterium]|nr:GHKL domain-containing protein [Candidatus Dependentiae bacterium]
KKNNISLTFTDTASNPVIYANTDQIKQVFVNLMFNAIYSLKHSGKQNKNIQIKMYDDLKFLIIEFFDNGTGIKKEHIDKVFDPYFTTKKTGDGTGLGLSISYSIIKLYNGEIKIESEFDESFITGELPGFSKSSGYAKFILKWNLSSK